MSPGWETGWRGRTIEVKMLTALGPSPVYFQAMGKGQRCSSYLLMQHWAAFPPDTFRGIYLHRLSHQSHRERKRTPPKGLPVAYILCSPTPFPVHCSGDHHSPVMILQVLALSHRGHLVLCPGLPLPFPPVLCHLFPHLWPSRVEQYGHQQEPR